MKKLKKILSRAAAVIAVLALLIVPASVFAAVGDVPSLFHNDEEWYKDGLYPLAVRNGEYYIPAELFSMFEYISVVSYGSDNVLIHNTANGQYVSVLFTDSSAAVNGQIVRNVGMFRDDDMYYVPADFVCEGIGMEYELFTTDDGKEHLRLFDDESAVTFDALILGYLDGNTGDENPSDDKSNVTKRIFLICKLADPYNLTYSAQLNLDYYGLNYTVFLTASAQKEKILSASAMGVYGALPTASRRTDGVDIANELDKINLTAYEYTGRKTRLTLSTGNAEEDRILQNHGYIPIDPDFTVNGSSDADAVFADILRRASKYGYATVYLEDCWNSTRIAFLLSEMTDPSYTTSNMINAGK
ncbi:MAG: hypothetical protein E7628_05055 [Ruminococcaceae bacterium]|nr:hypothetical protein [Oscillospiraceae bacterium]